MAAEPVKEAADPAREAEKAPPTVLHGTLILHLKMSPKRVFKPLRKKGPWFSDGGSTHFSSPTLLSALV